MNKGTIMIVEDNVPLAKLYEQFLSHAGFTIIFKTENGRDAVAFIKTVSEYPDLIIMDYRMPYKDGITASREILEINPAQKIILVSADDRIIKQVSAAGDIPFLQKPFNFGAFIKKINVMIQSESVDPLSSSV